MARNPLTMWASGLNFIRSMKGMAKISARITNTTNRLDSSDDPGRALLTIGIKVSMRKRCISDITTKSTAAIRPIVTPNDLANFGGGTDFTKNLLMHLSISNCCILLQNACAYFCEGVKCS